MIRAIIFDLDNCLAAATEVGEELMQPVFDAIRAANRGRLSDAQLERAFQDAWRIPLDAVAEMHDFSEEMLAAGWDISVELEVRKPMSGYADLKALADLPVQRFLVTSGFRKLQESKIKALGFAHLFTGIHVDAIDEGARKGKQGLFAEIMQQHGFAPEEILVVGDNPDSEIEAGKRLGMRTAQILRPDVAKGDNADFYVQSLEEIDGIVARS